MSSKKKNLPAFGIVHTKNPGEAIDILFSKAMRAAPVLSPTEVREEYEGLQEAWGLVVLVQGSSAEVKKILLRNAFNLARRWDFARFEVELYVPYGKPRAGLITAMFQGWGVTVHVWRTEDVFFACGPPDFLAEVPSGKE